MSNMNNIQNKKISKNNIQNKVLVKTVNYTDRATVKYR